MTRPSWDEWFLSMAHTASTRAACTRRQVGAVLADPEHHIISTGYNGAPSNFPHCGEGGCPRGQLDAVPHDSDYSTPGSPGWCPAIHAEMNCGIHAGLKAKGAIMYITDRPCPNCVKYLAAIGVSQAVWRQGETIMRMDPMAYLRVLTGLDQC